MQTFGANNSLYSILREQWFLFCLVTNSNYTIKLCPIKSFLGMFGFCILIAVMKMELLIHLKDVRVTASSSVTLCKCLYPMNWFTNYLFINRSKLNLRWTCWKFTNSQSIGFNSIPKSHFPYLSTVPYATEQSAGLFDISLWHFQKKNSYSVFTALGDTIQFYFLLSLQCTEKS